MSTFPQRSGAYPQVANCEIIFAVAVRRRSGLLRCPGHAAMLLAESTGGSAAGVGPTRPFLLPIRVRAECYGVSFPNSTAPQRPGPERSPSSTPTLALGATPQGLP